MKEVVAKLKKILKKLLKLIIKLILSHIFIFLIIVVAAYYIFVCIDGQNWVSKAAVSTNNYVGDTSIGNDGKITTANTIQEVWDKKKEKNERVDLYLSTPEELAKLMNAELVTQFLDTRPNPDTPIDWNSEAINNPNSNEVQGIIKLKRADTKGNITTMTYKDPETFQQYIDAYNESGTEGDKKRALQHFTLEKTSLSSGSANGQAEEIEEGTTIKIKSGLGSVHTYMGWQKITSPTSTQYKLREQAGMNFDTEGFGKINGRYVIACTTTFGKVGDYIDFYQEDGMVIPCIIGEIKSRKDKDCTKWGHQYGKCIVEFVVDKDSWYYSNHPNPGNPGCHPEWNQNLTKAVNGGSYFQKPDFGSNTVAENGKTIENDNNAEVMKWPTESTNISSEYGLRNSPTAGASSNHKGIDISVGEGTKVYACENGKVTTATESGTAGKYIVIDHGNGYVSKYMHNSELKVKVGANVKKGDLIALSGNTGVSTGAHLHFQIELDGEPVDPLTFKYDNDLGSGDGGIGSDSKNLNSSQTKYYAKVATWSETTDTVETNDPEQQASSNTFYNMTTTNINYQNFVSGYKMPFDYLWALLVIGEDKDFVLKLADLVYHSEIDITVHDNLTVTTNTKIDTYTKKTRTDTEGTVTISYGQEASVQNVQEKGNWSDEESNNYQTTYTNIVKTNTLDIALTRANVWIVDYQQEYFYQKPKKDTNTTYPKVKGKNYGDTPDSTSQDDTYGHVANLIKTRESETVSATTGEQYDFVVGRVDSIHTGVYHATVNKKRENINTIETTQYVSSPGKTVEKTDKKAKEDNFVTIMLQKECTKGRHLILDTRHWLYDILENKDTTKDMIDLTKYLLYKVTDKDYGVTEYDFAEIYDPANFVEVNTGAKSNLEGVPGQIADFFLEQGMSLEGVAAILGNIQQECNFNASAVSNPDYNGGYHGLCQWGNYKGDPNGRFAQLEKLAKREGKDWTNVDVQLKFMWKELTTGGYVSVKNDLMNANDAKKAAKKFAKDYEKCLNADGTIQDIDTRQKYAENWLKQLKQKASTGSAVNIDTSSFLATAKTCHDYLRENNYWYPSVANLSAGRFVSDGTSVKHKFPTRGEASSNRYMDCSAYVSWVLKEYGYNLSLPYTASGLLGNPLHLQEIAVSNVKAGDILVRNGHTEIFCGNGKAYNCGSTRAIRSVTSNCNPSGFTKAFRVNK